jgi:hypothetical protein
MSRKVVVYLVPATLLILLALVGYLFFMQGTSPDEPESPPVAEASKTEVYKLCALCHKYPPPGSFPKNAWRQEVKQGYQFAEEAGLYDLPPIESIIKYYEKRAPDELPTAIPNNMPGDPPVHFRCTGYRVPREQLVPAVSNVNLVHLFDDQKLDVLVCDMRDGWISVMRPYEKDLPYQILGKVTHPAHAEVVDLDGDGTRDIIVADLGSFYPTNAKVGKVVLLKGIGKGKFTPITLLENVGRVADVQAADFNGDGKIDLIVAVFGWRTTGEIILLENQTTDWSKPRFIPHVLDTRHGAIHVPVIPKGLNGSGKPDFVALISQEHETIVAFLNDGKGHFEKKTIYTGPHPAYGSSGIQLVDLNGDGKIDVLYTNGDTMDSGLFKPYHSIQWLENRGTFPFVHHHLTPMYAVHRAVAADFEQNGKKLYELAAAAGGLTPAVAGGLEHKGLKSIVAVSCLPSEKMLNESPIKQKELDSIILLKQTSPGTFVRYPLEKGTCDHITCAAGDLFQTGQIDLVIGNFYFSRETGKNKNSITIWQNLGR